MSPPNLVRARQAFERKAWAEAFEAFAADADPSALELDDFERHATAGHLLGRNEESRQALNAGYREAIRRRETARAARFAFWIGHSLMFEGAESECSGWLARGRQLLASLQEECVEASYLKFIDGVRRIFAGDYEGARSILAECHAAAARFEDLDLAAMTGHGLARTLVRLGDVEAGMTLLDTVMVSVAAGEVSPIVVGEVYCGALEACREVFDLRRAREWTVALARWCEGQPELVAHRGPCLVYRAEVMQFRGAWADALSEARRACEWLSEPLSPEGPGDAFYRIGELQRLRGNYGEAEEAYRRASRLGKSPEPGLPLLWLARGQGEAARAALLRAVEEAALEIGKQAMLLDAEVEVCLALGDLAGARSAAPELEGIAERMDSPYLKAAAARNEGALLLAEGEVHAALAPLRQAWSGWQRLEAPYQCALVRTLIGQVYHELGDHESAALEFDAARSVFEQLGALPDLARLDALEPDRTRATPAGLSAREVEVIQLVAAGRTNREIAAALVISEHTVARHVQNMLAKVGCASRAALATFAAEHGLVMAPDSQS